MDDTITALLDVCRRDHAAWINGDGSGYALPADGTILGAIGGYAFGGDETAQRQAQVASNWVRGSGDIEYLNGSADDGIAWLTFVEHARVLLAGEDQERRWDLRVTEVFRRTERGGWERIHRHADPLVDRRPVGAAADLLEAG